MKRRMLVVDDDGSILEVLEMRLSAMGYDVMATSDPERALLAAENERFDLALVDLRMNPIDGITLMEAMHQHQPRLPVLIMTAHGTIETAVEAVQRGAFDYLTKPFVRDELRAKIARALATRRWARDRERLLAVGETLASSGIMPRVLEAVAQAAVETTEAERSVVFLLTGNRLAPMATAGPVPSSWCALETAAEAATHKGAPTSVREEDGRTIVAAPLVVGKGPVGALVIETPPAVDPTEDDLELLALFSSQAAVAIRNTHELERLRSGALAALGRMATQVAHELKNPLAGLRLYARHLEQRLDQKGDAPGADIARKITSTVDHLAAVVTEITAFGRPAEVHRTPTDVRALLEECVTFARARVETPDVEVTCSYDPGCPHGMLDGRELRKVFLNLILNSLEALAPGGRVAVSTAWVPDARSVVITVEDDGAGMNEETLARAFDLFFTTKPSGTGLGMAIAKSVVDRHGGDLHIESTPGLGTRVRVRLPLEVADGEGP
jgi:signal transduction histidine kinase